MSYETIVVETHDRVGLVTLNRPEVLNALNDALVSELADAVAAFDRDDDIGAIVLTGNEKAFAAGADIAQMVDRSAPDMLAGFALSEPLERVARCRKPLVAAVAGFALGGGCELAMICDVIVAAESARFGQPEIKLGVLPGLGGTQRLTRAIGKAKSMDLCLTGRMMDAAEAERCGLVSRVVSAAKLLDEALQIAGVIAGMSLPAARLVKEAVNRADESTLTEGCRFEKSLFHTAFALEDQKEGMRAFLEKREPRWKHR